MNKIYKTRSIINDKGELIVSEIKLTKAILSHRLNKDVTIGVGWRKSSLEECSGPKPKIPVGEIGYMSCIGGEWVFIPT